MGIDIVSLMSIHPIGELNRKGGGLRLRLSRKSIKLPGPIDVLVCSHAPKSLFSSVFQFVPTDETGN
jgi:hypothetical protein